MMKEEKTTQLTRYNAQLPTTSMADIAQAGQLLAQSGMFGVRNAAAGFVVVATCHQQGISLMEFHRTYHIVEGRPSMRADAMLAEFRKAGGRYKIIENSRTRAAVEVTFEGQMYPFEYTMDDARRIGDCLSSDGKLKYNWQKRPEDMLWARLVSRFVRRLCPEINAGTYTPEEVGDFSDQQTAPMVISADEAVRRAKVVAPEAEPAPADTVGKAAINTPPDICPIGDFGYAGRPWCAFDTETLTAALECDDPAVTGAHKRYILEILEERGERQQEV